MDNFELIVIGGGPAGITLAKKLGEKFNMAVIRPEKHSMIYCAMPYVVEGIIPEEKTFKKDALITQNGAELIKDSVANINEKESKLQLKSGRIISYKKLIIATGAEPIIPEISGINFEGVIGFKTQEDLEKIFDFKKKGVKNAVIVGAGAIGVELAQALNASNINTYLVDMEQTILSNMIDGELINEIQAEIISNGIHFIPGEKVVAIKGNGVATGVEFESGNKLDFKTDDINCVDDAGKGPTCIVIFAIGVSPVLNFIDGTSIERGKNGIIVDPFMKTNVENIFACGDAVEFKSAITDTPYSGKLATNAVQMARILSDNLKGNKKEYRGFYNGTATKVYSHFLGGTGLTEKAAKKFGFKIVSGYGEATTMFPIMPGAKKIKVKIIAKVPDGTIIGGQIVSEEPVAAKIDLLTLAMQNKMKVEDLVDLAYSSQPYQSFFPAGNVMVMAAEDAFNKLKDL